MEEKREVREWNMEEKEKGEEKPKEVRRRWEKGRRRKKRIRSRRGGGRRNLKVGEVEKEE